MGIIHPMLLHPRIVEEIHAERLQRGAGPSRRAPRQQRVPATTGQGLPRALWAQRGRGPPGGQVALRGHRAPRGQGVPRGQGAQRGQGVPRGQGAQRGQGVTRGQGDPRVLVAPRAPVDPPPQRDRAPSATQQETPRGPGDRQEEVKDKQKAPRRPRVFKTRLNYLQMSEKQCQKRLRLSRETVTELCAMMQDDLRPMGFGGHSMPVALKLTATLSFYASGSFQGSTGQLCGISQAAAHRCIKEVTNALFKRAGEFIRYRTNPESQTERSMGFCAIAGFPRVQGVIDCTHVAIRAPSEQPAAFINKEGFYSISVQLVCDHRKRILQVCARFSGSSDDAYILQNSQVPDLFLQQPQLEGWILGDRSYPLQTWLMTPVKNPRTKAELQYNLSHSSTRATIKQTIGLLKMRFRCLDRSRGALKYDPTKVSQIVVVCCALHNLAQQRGEVLNAEDMEEAHCSSDEEGAETSSDEEHGEDQAEGEGERHHPEIRALKVRENLILSRFQDPAPL
ncbi:putative nuclease HARBI1 isoform X3 [Scyliorhinus torazame]|uniref:putative nuclease HARBI1 isoform X3 n=1 Tax=Scyliorhinus torazame TaxID=75743 RepID=UPI003B5A1EEF